MFRYIHLLLLLSALISPAASVPNFLRQFTALLSETANASVIPEPVYHDLFKYAHLLDIAYCIDAFRRISPPFECDLECSASFPHMQLVNQWYFENSVCGYIASTNDTLFFGSGSSNGNGHTIVVAIRGTRSISDTMTDFDFGMASYSAPGNSIPSCGVQCRVHSGFYRYYRDAIDIIHPYVMSELKKGGPNSKLVIVGHSLGGAVGLLAALHYLSIGVANVELVTMGQPLVGNRGFTEWADFVLGSEVPVEKTSGRRKWLRVIHRNDIITTIPRGSFLERYHQFSNQVYINASSANSEPSLKQVVDCGTGDNIMCIEGDVQRPRLASDYLLSHNTYFRHLGLCGIHSDSRNDQ